MTPTDEERRAAWARLMRARAAEREARGDYRARSTRCEYRDRAISRAYRLNVAHAVVAWLVVSAVVIGLLTLIGWPEVTVRALIGGVMSGLTVSGLRGVFVERVRTARRRHPEPDAEEVLRARYEQARRELTEAECDPATLPAEYTEWTASMQEVADGLDVRDRYDPPGRAG